MPLWGGVGWGISIRTEPDQPTVLNRTEPDTAATEASSVTALQKE